jgi:hypothetical protein
MFCVLSWFAVIALLALWSLAAWALHAVAVWTVSNAGALTGAASGAGTIIDKTIMDTSTLLFAILTLCLVGVTLRAWRLGNEKRDVVLLGVFSGLMGAGAAASAIL